MLPGRAAAVMIMPATLTAIAIIATANDDYGRALATKLEDFRVRQSDKVLAMKLPDA